ncbi:MAG: efflux RND transporter periplasmic adaptor subunit, partial [Bacteroidales bacterium]|nr:efflux RND transporter periplasmic adaptor subunit [Bacteroidales bacterium]
ERNIAELTARFGGRIEKLFVNFTGQNVRQGEKLATIYSPDLITAQRELLEAVSFKENRPSFYTSVKAKLKLWDLTDNQISAIEENGEPQLYFDVLSPISGTVMMRHVALGDYVREGSALFQVTDLKKVWVMFDAYESDLPWINMGDHVELTIPSIPGKEFDGKVAFIDPFIDAKTRIAKVRIELSNPGLKLKPEMFANGVLHSNIAESSDHLLIPKSSILWTGKRAVVYVKVPDRESPSFLYREITSGPEAGNFYVVADGLEEGEQIVVNGVFKIDAAAQLEGKPSMMNPQGGRVSTGHDHGGMEMPASAHDEHGDHANPGSEMNHAMVTAAGNCDMCKERIENAALSVTGVETATWEAESQMLHLNFDAGKTNSAEIQQAVAKAGHDTEDFKAPDEVYEELPGCCLYERLD